MVQTKKMNEDVFADLEKKFSAAAELIRLRQGEKQSVLDEFDAATRRFFFGSISEKALDISVKKTNTELQRLDKDIRDSIREASSVAKKAILMAQSQKPVSFRASLAGIKTPAKRKSSPKKRNSKKSNKKR